VPGEIGCCDRLLEPGDADVRQRQASPDRLLGLERLVGVGIDGYSVAELGLHDPDALQVLCEAVADPDLDRLEALLGEAPGLAGQSLWRVAEPEAG